MRFSAYLAPDRLEPDAELRVFLERLAGEGGVVSFVGVARPTAADGSPIRGLQLDHYPGMTERSLEAIVADGRARFAITDAMVVHRCGFVPAGEPIVFAAAAAPHRRAAVEAADYLMDRLKTDAVFWKREDGIGAGHWIEPSDKDHADRKRWD